MTPEAVLFHNDNLHPFLTQEIGNGTAYGPGSDNDNISNICFRTNTPL